MARLTFIGGIRPYSGKELSREKKTRDILPQEGRMVFPLKQHIGAPAVPVVQPGDWVRCGQRIARADGELSANLHASVSGQVTALEEVPDISGEPVPSIVIENDGQYVPMPVRNDVDPTRMTSQEILTAIRDAGIVGLGGSGLPTDYKLLNANRATMNMVIANCVECEPYLTGDYRRILEDPWKVIDGLAILLGVFPKARGIIAVSESNREGFRLLRELLIDNPRIYVRQCKDKYPQGSERQLIHAVTGRTLNARMLPYEIGCMVVNTQTLAAVSDAVLLQEPLTEKIMTVSGPAAASPCNLRVRCGVTYREVLEQAGGLRRCYRDGNALLLAGGPLTGKEIRNLDAPVTKLSLAITCLPRSMAAIRKETPCIRCRRCVQACPNQIVPMQLVKDARLRNKPAFAGHAGMECCDCGCCSYVCPAGIDLAAQIGAMKRECLRKSTLAGEYGRRYQN